MRPFTIYHLHQDLFSFLQKQLIDLVVKAASPDKIFLLGASLHRRRSESIFNSDAPSSQYIADCCLLILLKDTGNKELYEWQNKIETNCKTLMPVTTIVLKTTSFEDWLKDGHFFAASVQQSAALIYDYGNIELSGVQTAVDNIAKPVEKLFVDGLTKAKEFLAGSELFRVRKQYVMAAFMLHQSAEQALRALLKAGTGYHANTHSIERLLRYASLVSYQLPDVFPQQTEEEKRLFSLFQKAYSDTRYKEDYKITGAELVYLSAKVRRVHEILVEIGKGIFNRREVSIH